MAEPERLTQILGLLDGVANAPLTESQRLQRAEPALKQAGLAIDELARSLQEPALAWNQSKASQYGTTIGTWLQAQRVVGLPDSRSLADFLARLHRAEAAVAMLKAGYRAQTDASGGIVWASPQAERPRP